MLFWACIVWHRLSVNQIVRCFKLKKLKNYMNYQVDFLLPLKLQKTYYFELYWKILLANQFAGFSTFDLFSLLILILGVHCCTVLVSQVFSRTYQAIHLCKLVIRLFALIFYFLVCSLSSRFIHVLILVLLGIMHCIAAINGYCNIATCPDNAILYF